MMSKFRHIAFFATMAFASASPSKSQWMETYGPPGADITALANTANTLIVGTDGGGGGGIFDRQITE